MNVFLPGTYARCMSGHYYAQTRGDEECPICEQLAELRSQLDRALSELVEARKRIVAKFGGMGPSSTIWGAIRSGTRDTVLGYWLCSVSLTPPVAIPEPAKEPHGS